MYIYSEKTNQRYNTVDECLEAEAKFDKAVAEEKAKKDMLASERKDRAKEVEDAFKHAHTLLGEFVEDYGSFHFTLGNDKDDTFLKLFDWLF